MKEQQLIVFYFLFIASLGTLALSLPIAWNGSEPLGIIDAAFTATSAVCVTGLITVDTALYSFFGKTVIMMLIQAGGLGIITFATLLLLVPGRRISFHNRRMIKNFFVEGVEYEPVKIIKNILLITFAIEAVGAVILAIQFKDSPDGLFNAVFHSVSAFCNAGFSTFTTSLEQWNQNPAVLLTIGFLIIAGGISFVVMHDLVDTVGGKKRRLSLHSVVVLLTTVILILIGAIVFWFSEASLMKGEMTLPARVANAFFHSVTPRTAGFNSLPMGELSESSRTLTLILMFIGGAPGSMAGGIKVTTLFLILLGIFRGIDDQGDSAFGHYRISARAVSHAGLFFIKAVFLVATAVWLLMITERQLLVGGGASLFDVMFEAVSALGTVGLSLGITPQLSSWGKIILIVTMFSGRIGLVFMASERVRFRHIRNVDYPHGEVLTG